MMKHNARRVGRQAREPYPEPEGTRKWCWNRMPKDKGDKPRNPTPNQKEPGNDDGTECQKRKERSPGTLLRTRRNQEMMMEQNARRVGKQAPEPYTQKHRKPGNNDGTECQKDRETSPGTLHGIKNHDETKTVSWKNWEPHSAPELFPAEWQGFSSTSWARPGWLFNRKDVGKSKDLLVAQLGHADMRYIFRVIKPWKIIIFASGRPKISWRVRSGGNCIDLP